ncbi:MAG: penicillin acylase family protein [Rhodospirillales bacterium]
MNWVQKGLAGLTAVLTAIVCIGVTWLGTSLPQTTGEIQLEPLKSSVKVYRDTRGIPHIYASNLSDAYHALGFAHAQDRFAQMELMRRHGNGRLAEVVGARAIPSDRFMRTLGFNRLVEAQFLTLLAPSREVLQAYSDGVNSWLKNRRSSLPLEMIAIGYSPDPWRPEDSLIWGRIMAMWLSGNWRTEFLRLQMSSKLSPEKINALWPQIDFQDEIKQSLGAILPEKSAKLIDELRQVSDSGASNSWVIDGTKTRSGKPILANDPHLGFLAPIMWYLADLNTPKHRMTGGTVPGVPFVVLGHNKKFAWGVTSTHPDLQDLFIETVTDEGYLTPTGPKAFIKHKETIKVKGADDIEITVRISRHGPIISDALPDLKKALSPTQVIALSATFLRSEDQSPDAYFGINTATSLGEFKQALKHLDAPHLSMTYADTSGNTARFLPGLLPNRRKDRGQFPQMGSATPLAPNINGLNPYAPPFPGGGYIVEANSKTVPTSFPHFISGSWAPGFRTRQIASLLTSNSKHTLKDSWEVIADNVSPLANELLPIMLQFLLMETNESRLLKAWNGVMSRRRIEPTIFMNWIRELNLRLYGDELGDLTPKFLRLRPLFLKYALTSDQIWCDNTRTTENEDCSGVVTQALNDAIERLRAQYGSNVENWKWGTVHLAYFRHPVFSSIPLLGKWADLSIPSDGGAFTINRGNFRLNRTSKPFRHTHGAGIRALYDLNDLNNSRFIIATGQSGNIVSPHYRDFLEDWRDNNWIAFAQDEMALRRAGANLLRLVPKI